jgi:hypothetical protein
MRWLRLKMKTNKLNDLQNTTQKTKDPAARIQIALKLSGFSYTARAYERGFQTIHRTAKMNEMAQTKDE